MSYKQRKIDSIAALCGLIWFAFIIDACFTWFFSWTIRYFLSSFFVFFATSILSQNNGLNFSKKRILLFSSIAIWAAIIFFLKFWVVVAIFKFTPFMCIIFWRDSALQKMYVYLRKFILFYAILSVFVEVLVVTGAWRFLPHTTLPPQDYVQEELGLTNYFYGLFVIPAEDLSLSFYRACGPGREGGHFVFYLGFIYFADKALYNKRNIWILICGMLTLSPNFPVILLITEGYHAIKHKEFIKPIMVVLLFVVAMALAFVFAPENIKDEIVRVILERSLENNLMKVEDEGVWALIDGRAGPYGLQYYESFLRKGTFARLFGSELPDGYYTSDPRFLIMLYGYIGTFVICWCIITFSIKIEFNLFGFVLLSFAALIFIQRAWMFDQLYWETVMLLIIKEKERLSYKV